MKIKTITLTLSLLFAFCFGSELNAQGFKFEGFKHKEFQGVSVIPDVGYAISKLQSMKIVVDVVDLNGEMITTLKVPQKILKTSKFREEKAKVFYNGTSFCVVMPKNLGNQNVYTFDVNGKNIGTKKFSGNVLTVTPKEEGYFIKGGGSMNVTTEQVFSNELKTEWEYTPPGATKFYLTYMLAGGDNITSKNLPYAKTEGATLNKEYLDAYPVVAAGTEDRYLFDCKILKGSDKTKNEGMVCLDTKGKELFSSFYEKGTRKMLSAISHNKDTYVLFRTYPKKGANAKSTAEIVKYDAAGKVVKTVSIPKDKLPVISDYMFFFMEKTPDGIAVLTDALGYFYSVYLDENLAIKKNYAFEGKNYKRKNEEPKMSAIGSFPWRSIFSGVTASGTPYVSYLDKKSGVETARITSFAGKNLLSSETEKNVEDHIQVYYGTLSPMGSLMVDYGEVQSHHEIYSNLVHPVDANTFSIVSFLETKKILLCKNYKIGEQIK